MPDNPPASTEPVLAQWLRGGRDDTRDLLRLTESPGTISFAGGLPAPELFPREAVGRAFQKVIEQSSGRAFQYGPAEGVAELRELVAARLTARARRDVGGGVFRQENILITTGSQQALDLFGKVFIDEGDVVATEAPTFLGFFDALRPRRPRFLTLAQQAGAWSTLANGRPVNEAPRLSYILPNFQNPSGTCLGLEARHNLLAYLAPSGSPIIEDDPYGRLRYDGADLPHLASLATAAEDLSTPGQGKAYGGSVIHLGSISKTLVPALRIGWVAAATPVISALTRAKVGADIATSALTQLVTYELLNDGFEDEHVGEIRAFYRARRDAMLEALEREMPRDFSWTRPEGGLFIWVTGPPDVSTAALFEAAMKRGVGFVKGAAFYADGISDNNFRLNYSNADPGRIAEGIRRLAAAIADVRR
jgi:2-aminoadipate transaminase